MDPRKYMAEAIGTFWLVLAGCGSVVLAAGADSTFGFVGIGLSFGLAVTTMAYAIGHVSGCHLNPAVTLGLAAAQRFPWREVLPYWIFQIIGGVAGAAVLYLIANGVDGFDATASGFAANGYDEHSPGGYSLGSGLIVEIVMTAIFVFVIMGATHGRAPAGFAPLAIGLTLALIHFVSITVTGTSVNPARSTAVALFVGDWALAQLWLFWVAPLAGGVIGAVVYRWVSNEPRGEVVGTDR